MQQSLHIFSSCPFYSVVQGTFSRLFSCAHVQPWFGFLLLSFDPILDLQLYWGADVIFYLNLCQRTGAPRIPDRHMTSPLWSRSQTQKMPRHTALHYKALPEQEVAVKSCWQQSSMFIAQFRKTEFIMNDERIWAPRRTFYPFFLSMF